MKDLFTKVTSGGSSLLLAIVLVNFINFIFNAYLGRVLTFPEFGLVTLINTMWYLLLIPCNALYSTVNHSVSHMHAREATKKSTFFLQMITNKALMITVVLSVIWIIMTPFLDSFFQVQNIFVSLAFTPVIILGVLTAVNRGYLQGSFAFLAVAVTLVSEAFSKLLFAVGFVTFREHNLVFTAIPLGVLMSFLFSFYFIHRKRKLHTEKIDPEQLGEKETFPKQFFIAALITGIASVAFLTVDLILAKHYLSPVEAGKYALLSLIGKMIYFFGTLPNILMITLITRDIAKNMTGNKTFYTLFLASVLLSVGSFVGLGVFGRYFVPLLFGAKSMSILPYLPVYCAAIMFFSLASIVVSFHLARKQYLFPIVAIIMAVILSGGILIFHKNITLITNTIFYTGVFSFLVISILHFIEVHTQVKMRILHRLPYTTGVNIYE